MQIQPTRPRRQPRLVVFAGLPGTGKSTLARLLADRLGAIWLRVDLIEASLLKAGIPRSFETGLSAYVVARDIAREHLNLHRDVIIDAVNGVEPARRMWRSVARECHASRFVVEVRCSDPVEHRRRIQSRRGPTPPLPAPSWEEVVQREYLPWKESVLSIDGLNAPAENVSRVVDFLSKVKVRQ
ncbi:MAG TPA: AAA family ATPase [Thermoplasmata archaeon]|nr:AAA family ATPase [Thermoplasmata archaeon]